MVRQNWLLIGSIVIVAILIASQFHILGLGLVSPPTSVSISDGKVFYLMTLTVPRTESTTALLQTTPYTLPNGSVITPNKNITMTFTPGQQICSYRLDKVGEPTIFGYNLNLYQYYTPGNPELSALIDVTSDSSTTHMVLDGTIPGNSSTVRDNDGNGIIKAEVQGVLGGKANCPDTSGIVVLNVYGTPKAVDSATYFNIRDTRIRDAEIGCSIYCVAVGVSSPYCLSCVSNSFNNIINGSVFPEASNFKGEFDGLTFADPSSTQVKTKLTGVVKAGSTRFANPVITVTADQDYVNALLYNRPTQGTPRIASLSCNQVQEANTGTVRAILENVGQGSDTFTYTISSNKGSITPSTGSVSIAPNNQITRDFVFAVPSVSVDEQYTLSMNVCSPNQFGPDICTQAQCSNTILNSASPPPQKFCGDSVCSPEIGETTSTCQRDCTTIPVVSCTDIPNSDLVNGACICKNGFSTKYDQNTGKQICEAPNEWMKYLPYAIIGLAALAFGYAIFGKRR